MERESQLSTHTMNDDDGTNKEQNSDEEFYEKIEAPKFVDFTVPDRNRPDDRYWFCLRVGCDQKHEEEMDSEAIYKNFILRVMAARSPNVRLRKALSRNTPSANLKCPLSAPSKSSKSRISRLAAISSISQKLVDEQAKIKAAPKSSTISTPKAKGKQVAAKYLTTPRNKNCLSNSNSFRSVQNPKLSSLAVPKNRTVAKALVFHSPKKVINIKTSAELRTPLTKICEGMKRLEITNQKKRMFGYSSKLSKEIRVKLEKSLLKDSSRRQPITRKDKSNHSLSKMTSDKLLDGSGGETKSLQHSEGRDLEEKCELLDKDDKENALKENEPVAMTGHERSEVMDSDDKENASGFSENRDVNRDINQTGKGIVGKQMANDNPKKGSQPLDKKTKDGLTPSSAKYRKPKPTNPKPFRLRTDERGILKEANLGKKIISPAPQKEEAATTSRFRGGNLKIMHGVHKNEQLSEESERNKDTLEDACKEIFQENEHKQNRASVLKNSRGKEEPKTPNLTSQRNFKLKNQELNQATKNSFRKIGSPSLHGQLRFKGVASTRKITANQRLDVVTETPLKIARSKEAGKPRGKPVTIPKEPPKSCTWKIA